MQGKSIEPAGADKLVILFFFGIMVGSIIANLVPFFVGSGYECMECRLYHSFYVESCKIFYNVPLSAAHPRFDNDRSISCNDDSVCQEASVYYSGIYWCSMGND